MSDIKCLENFERLKEMLLKGEKGNGYYFSSRLNISTRTFFRLLKYLYKIDGIKVKYDKTGDTYNLE